jgi:hypothetical protein
MTPTLPWPHGLKLRSLVVRWLPGSRPLAGSLSTLPQISPTCRTKDGSTPLHYAAAFGQTHVLAPLVAAGCAVDVRDNALNTPMHLAAGGWPPGIAPCRVVDRCLLLQQAAFLYCI